MFKQPFLTHGLAHSHFERRSWVSFLERRKIEKRERGRRPTDVSKKQQNTEPSYFTWTKYDNNFFENEKEEKKKISLKKKD